MHDGRVTLVYLSKLLRLAAGSYGNQMTLVSMEMSLVPRQEWSFYRLLIAQGFCDDCMVYYK